jgi:hypothetical protein
LVPTLGEGQPIPVNKTNELPVVLDFVFQEVEGEVQLGIGQVCEVEVS